jgi:hypothetical protein
MKLNRKIEIAYQAITSISRHRDEDAALRMAALDRVIECAQDEKANVAASVSADIAAKLAPDAE